MSSNPSTTKKGGVDKMSKGYKMLSLSTEGKKKKKGNMRKTREVIYFLRSISESTERTP
jgi:hypothetical protein